MTLKHIIQPAERNPRPAQAQTLVFATSVAHSFGARVAFPMAYFR